MSDASEIVICAPNWLGDGIMSLPAVQRFSSRNPGARLTILARPSVLPLWTMLPAAARVLPFERGAGGVVRAVHAVCGLGCGRAFVFPNSFRSALVPFLAQVPRRTGARGHQRAWMLTDVVSSPGPSEWRHQAWEYFRILGVGDEPPAIELPIVRPPAAVRAAAESRLQKLGKGPWVAVLPGAERGPSKRWPPGHFAEVCRSLTALRRVRVLVLGTAKERPVCEEVARSVGATAVSLAGQTTLPDLAGLLSCCRLAITNDSGGMHLAAALGVRVVAVFGMTDPDRTGPLGPGHRLVRRVGVQGARDIKRRSRQAAEVLAGIEPPQVLDAVLRSLDEGDKAGG